MIWACWKRCSWSRKPTRATDIFQCAAWAFGEWVILPPEFADLAWPKKSQRFIFGSGSSRHLSTDWPTLTRILSLGKDYKSSYLRENLNGATKWFLNIGRGKNSNPLNSRGREDAWKRLFSSPKFPTLSRFRAQQAWRLHWIHRCPAVLTPYASPLLVTTKPLLSASPSVRPSGGKIIVMFWNRAVVEPEQRSTRKTIAPLLPLFLIKNSSAQ